jgi:hypothetical protein
LGQQLAHTLSLHQGLGGVKPDASGATTATPFDFARVHTIVELIPSSLRWLSRQKRIFCQAPLQAKSLLFATAILDLTETTALLGFVWQFFSFFESRGDKSFGSCFFQGKRPKPRLGFGLRNYYLISKPRDSDHRSLKDVEISSSLIFSVRLAGVPDFLYHDKACGQGGSRSGASCWRQLARVG